MRVLYGEIRDDIDLLAFGPGERVAAAAAGRDRVDVWDAATGRRADAWQARGLAVTDLGCLPDGRVLACVGGHPLQVIDPDSTGRYGTEFPGRDLGPVSAVAAAGGAVFTTHVGIPPRVVCWRPAGDGAYAVAWSHPIRDSGVPMVEVTADPGGRRVALVDCTPSWSVVVRNAADGAERRRIAAGPVPPRNAYRLRFSPDGEKVLAVRAGAAELWNAATGEHLGRFPATDPKAVPTDAAFHPSGRWLLTSSTDGTVRVWDADRLAEATAFRWGVGKLRAVAVGPDGAVAAAGGEDGRVVVWDLDL